MKRYWDHYKHHAISPLEDIEKKIFPGRGYHSTLDRHLAEIYNPNFKNQNFELLGLRDSLKKWAFLENIKSAREKIKEGNKLGYLQITAGTFFAGLFDVVAKPVEALTLGVTLLDLGVIYPLVKGVSGGLNLVGSTLNYAVNGIAQSALGTSKLLDGIESKALKNIAFNYVAVRGFTNMVGFAQEGEYLKAAASFVQGVVGLATDPIYLTCYVGRKLLETVYSLGEMICKAPATLSAFIEKNITFKGKEVEVTVSKPTSLLDGPTVIVEEEVALKKSETPSWNYKPNAVTQAPITIRNAVPFGFVAHELYNRATGKTGNER